MTNCTYSATMAPSRLYMTATEYYTDSDISLTSVLSICKPAISQESFAFLKFVNPIQSLPHCLHTLSTKFYTVNARCKNSLPPQNPFFSLLTPCSEFHWAYSSRILPFILNFTFTDFFCVEVPLITFPVSMGKHMILSLLQSSGLINLVSCRSEDILYFSYRNFKTKMKKLA